MPGSNTKNVTASLTAQNTFTDPISLYGKADLSVSGVTDSTVTLQRSFDRGVTWRDIEAFTTSVEKLIDASHQPNVIYRIGIKTAEYGTDTVVCTISQLKSNVS